MSRRERREARDRRAAAADADGRCVCGPGSYRLIEVVADGEPVPDPTDRCHRCGGRVTVCRIIEEIVTWEDLGKRPPRRAVVTT
jgi:hypothetical protein